MSILATECNADHHQIVNMFQVVTNHFLSVFRAAIVDHEVPRGPSGNLIGNVAWEDELTIIPANLNLYENVQSVNHLRPWGISGDQPSSHEYRGRVV